MTFACFTCGALNRDSWAECVLCCSPRAPAQPARDLPPPEPGSELAVSLVDLPRHLRPDVPYPPRAPTAHPRRWPGIARLKGHDSVSGMLERVTTWRWWEPRGESWLRLITAPAAVALRVPGHGLVAVDFRGRLLAEPPPPRSELCAEGAWRSVRRFEAARIARMSQLGARDWVATA